MTDPVLAEVIDPSVLKARRAARAARDVADTLVDARREAIGAERSALTALRTAAAHARARANRRAALEADRASASRERDDLAASLVTERRAREELERRLAAEQARRVALSGELRSARAAHQALAAELEGARAERDRLATALGDARSAATPPAAGTAGRAGPPAPASLQALAAQQVAAAAARAQGPAVPGRPSTSSTVAADLERAAAALRARTAAPPESGDADAPGAPAAAGTVTSAGAAAPRGASGAVPADAASITSPSPDLDRPSATRGPAGSVAYSESPSLRSVLARFAHGNPAAAGILLAGLLPAQGPIVGAELDYDLTIRGTGTFAVTLGDGTARVRSLSAPRGRGAAGLQLTAEPAALAELLAGSRRRVGRLQRDLRFRGSRRALELLEPIVHAELSLADAVRAGARIDPVAALLAMAVAVPADWTRGHRFTVEHVIDPGQSRRVYLHARDGAGLHAATSFAARPDATIRLSAETFHALLRDERPAPGVRPHVRGDRAAVAALRSWADRVLGR